MVSLLLYSRKCSGLMHVLNVNSSLDFQTGGGTAERTFQMSRFLALQSAQCTVLTLDTGLDESRINALKPAEVVTIPLLLKRFYVPKTRWKLIRSLVDSADVIHLMGHWSVLNALVYIALRRAHKPYAVCPAGALPLFGRSKWLKHLYNFIIGNRIIRNASAWIAVTSAEFPHFESYGIPASKVTVIPNGVCKEDFPLVDLNAFRHSQGLLDKPTILFMGRLNPIKGPDLLLRAFALVHDRIPEYQLVFAGPDEGMQSALVDIAKKEGIIDSVHFLGFVSGNDKSAAYRIADLLVVPSRQEAMSIVALEAGICGTPVMLTDQCGFGEIKSIHADLEVSADIAGIADGLIRLLSQPTALENVAISFQKLVIEKYTWDSIVHNYLNLYENMLPGASIKLNILIVSQYFWPENFRINDLTRSLAERGHAVEVLTGKPNYPEGKIFSGYSSFGSNSEHWHGIKIYRVPIVARGSKSGIRLALNYFSFVVSGLLLAPWLLRKKKYDVIFVYAPSPIFQSIPASFLGWLKGCPVALWVQDLWPESAQATGYVSSPWLLKQLENMVRFVYRHTDLLLIQSKAFQAPVAKLAPGKPIVYYPNSVEPAFYDLPHVALPDIPGFSSKFSVLFAGNIGVGQAVQVIVEAAELLKDYPEIHFIMLGKGSRWAWVQEQVSVRNLNNLHLPGSYSVEVMPGLMKLASALLVTLADQPIFAATIPSKVQAYMAVGRPILACLNGEGARLVAEANVGLVVPAEDATALADAVLRLYRMSDEDREAMGQNGRIYYKKHFDHDQLVEQLTGQFHELTLSFGKKR